MRERESPNAHVTTPDILRKWIKYLHRNSGLTDRQIATKPYFSGIPAGTLNTIRNHGKVPKKWKQKLHVVCQNCGRVSHHYDCTQEALYTPATQRPTALPGTGRQRPARTEICAGTELSEIIRRVERVTGYKLALAEGEIEY